VEDHSRLEELRRRVDKDPASIAFAPLAEELRKAGEYDEAVRVCLAGLEHHPAYLSARVTLGRALLELQHYAEARQELEYVLQSAPDNLLAQKAMHDLADRDYEPPPLASPPEPAAPLDPPAPPPHPALGELEGWHARIQADRAQRTGRS
jgi:tetratricopeptide (TPR) repeat protein